MFTWGEGPLCGQSALIRRANAADLELVSDPLPGRGDVCEGASRGGVRCFASLVQLRTLGFEEITDSGQSPGLTTRCGDSASGEIRIPLKTRSIPDSERVMNVVCEIKVY